MVAARQVRGSLRLPLFGRRAPGVLGHGRRRAAARKEVVPLHEQSLLGEVRRECGDDQAAAWRADRRRISGNVSRSISGIGRSGKPPIINQQSTIGNSGYSLTYILVITSPRSIFAGTSAPAITRPKTV